MVGRIEVQLEPIAEGQAELAREVARLEAEGKQIQEIHYPEWATNDLGIVAGSYGPHRATRYFEWHPGKVAVIVYED